MLGPMVLDQADPVVVGVLQGFFLGPSSQPYNLRRPEIEDHSERGQLAHLLDVIGGKVRYSLVPRAGRKLTPSSVRP